MCGNGFGLKISVSVCECVVGNVDFDDDDEIILKKLIE